MAAGQFRMLRCGMAGVEAVTAESRHAFPRHIHDRFGIGVIKRGAQKSLSGRGVVEAGPGNTITVNPGEVHDGTPLDDAGRMWRMLYLDPRLVAEAVCDMSEGRAGGLELPRPVLTDSCLARRFRNLFTALTAAPTRESALLAEEQLLLLLASMMREQGACAAGRGIPQSIARARSRIDEDPAAALSLSDLAQTCGLSRFQLLRGFGRATGLTPHAYLLQRRIQLARRLIATGASLADAALGSGFADQSHMTRVFVRTYGVSPAAYAGAVLR
ncbi:AraC family transcriptional regulator [Microvirga aerilata]|uniref:AraC family transcriptional regulator n=1 Tax=Microvirga aerilata TaxID=670292 RepID=A0A936ZD96_9HYPH|nr:AraC family transcriptional regulator [Microvirga aerilata]MBL0402699.1 AraC family transcriptional regulator [Microvirga aerilata]